MNILIGLRCKRPALAVPADGRTSWQRYPSTSMDLPCAFDRASLRDRRMGDQQCVVRI